MKSASNALPQSVVPSTTFGPELASDPEAHLRRLPVPAGLTSKY